MFRLDLESLSDIECYQAFRFHKDDKFLLNDVLRFPDKNTVP